MIKFQKHRILFSCLELITLAGVFVFTCLMLFYQGAGTVKATLGMKAFGGKVLFSVPAIPFPPCPAHTVIFDYISNMNIGVYTLPPFADSFDYNNLITPGVATLGEVLPVPFFSCPVPYPVYPAFFNGEFGRYQIGTALMPGF